MACPRAVLAVSVITLWLAVAPASAGTRDRAGCNVETPYAMQVDTGGLRFEATGDASPKRVEIHDGTLRVDGAARQVSAADARRLREIEAGTRALLPDIAAVAREAIHIGFDALDGMQAALGGDPRRARDIEALRQRALLRVEQTLGRGSWHPQANGRVFEADLAAAAHELATPAMPARVVRAALTRGAARLHHPMTIEGDRDHRIATRERALEAQADAVCARLDRLHRLQDTLELRLEDGRPLRLFNHRAEPQHGDGTAPARPRTPTTRAPPR